MKSLLIQYNLRPAVRCGVSTMGGFTDAECSPLLCSSAGCWCCSSLHTQLSSHRLVWHFPDFCKRGRRTGALNVIEICKHCESELSIFSAVHWFSAKVLPLKYQLCGFPPLLLAISCRCAEWITWESFVSLCTVTASRKIQTDSSYSKAWGHIFE